VLFVSVLLIITLFLFQIVKTGGSGSIDNRTAGRSAALNEICQPAGVVPGQMQTVGQRDDSVILITCNPGVDGEERLPEDQRFWPALTRIGDAQFPDFNRQQEGVGNINLVHSEQLTWFNRDFNIGQGLLASNLTYSNETLTPMAETWRFDVQAWAEGHDKVVWDRFTQPHRRLFPRVYPSALQPTEDPCSRVNQHNSRQSGGRTVGINLSNGNPFGGSGGGNSQRAETDVRGTIEIGEMGGSLLDVSEGSDLGNAWECQRTRFLFFENTLSIVTNKFEVFGLDLHLPAGIEGQLDAGIYRAETVTLNKDSNLLITDSIDLGTVDGEVRVQLDDGGIELEADLSGRAGRARREWCMGAGAGTSGCAGVDASVLQGDIGGEIELSPEEFEIEGSVGGNILGGGADVKGTLQIGDIPIIGDSVPGVIGDTQISGEVRIEVGVGGGQVATPPGLGEGVDIKSTSGGITAGIEGEFSISNQTVEDAVGETINQGGDRARDALRDIFRP